MPGSSPKIGMKFKVYAHPEMQRSYVKYILGSIEKLKLVKTTGINICFVTHSPFILSDIPESNILFLNEFGKPEPVFQILKTFGGNIHDLLAHSFFLKDGAIGAFAFDKINCVIKNINSDQTFNTKEKADLLQNIDLIGEPFLRNKILDMYYSKFDKSKRIYELEAELEKLKSE